MQSRSTIKDIASQLSTFVGLRQWFDDFLRPGPRLIDELECVISVLLAIVLAHLLGAKNVSWAAFTGYIVMREIVSDSLVRGGLRIVGTLVGAGLAVWLTPHIVQTWPMASLAAGVIGAVSLYGAMTGRRSYAWLLVGLTFEMTLFDSIEFPHDTVSQFAISRILEVLAGTVACVLVSAVSSVTVRRYWPGKRAPASKRLGWNAKAAWHALQCGVALALLPPAWVLFHVPSLSQSAISVLAVMLVPVSALGDSGLAPVNRRLGQRVVGCCIGGLAAAVVLIVGHGWVPILIVGTVFGVALGRHLENSGRGYSYIGLQFTLAVLVVLVPDSYANAVLAPGLERLVGILFGLLLLEPILAMWHMMVPVQPAPKPPLVGRDKK